MFRGVGRRWSLRRVEKSIKALNVGTLSSSVQPFELGFAPAKGQRDFNMDLEAAPASMDRSAFSSPSPGSRDEASADTTESTRQGARFENTAVGEDHVMDGKGDEV